MTPPQTELEKVVSEVTWYLDGAKLLPLSERLRLSGPSLESLDQLLLAAKRIPELEQRVKEVEKENEDLHRVFEVSRITALVEELSTLRTEYLKALEALKDVQGYFVHRPNCRALRSMSYSIHAPMASVCTCGLRDIAIALEKIISSPYAVAARKE